MKRFTVATLSMVLLAIPAIAGAQSQVGPPAPTPTPLPPGPHFSATSSAVFKATGPLNVLYVDYDPLHYTNAKVIVTTKTIDAPDISKVFAPLTGGSTKGVVPTVAGDVAAVVRAINGDSEQACMKLGTSSAAYFTCRANDADVEITTLAAIYARDLARADALLDPASGEIAKEVAKDDQLLSGSPRGGLSPTVTIPNRAKSEAADLAGRLSSDPHHGWQDVIVNGYDPNNPAGSPTPPAPTPFLPSQGRPARPSPRCAPVAALPPPPASEVPGLIEITDGCATLLAMDLDRLSKDANAARNSANAAGRAAFDAPIQALDAKRKLLAPYVTGGTDATTIATYHARLAQIDAWARRFYAVNSNDFSIGTSTPCNTGAGGSTATVHFTANDRFAGTIDPKKPEVDKDVVVVTCYSPLVVGAAGGWSFIPQTTYFVSQSSVQTNGPSTGNPPSPAPAFQTTYQLQQSQNPGRTIAGVFLHRCLCQNPSDGANAYASFALAGAAKDFPNVLLGLSIGFNHQYFLTVGGNYGSDTTLTSPNKVGDFVPSGYSIQTGKRYVVKPAITFGIATGK